MGARVQRGTKWPVGNRNGNVISPTRKRSCASRARGSIAGNVATSAWRLGGLAAEHSTSSTATKRGNGCAGSCHQTVAAAARQTTP